MWKVTTTSAAPAVVVLTVVVLTGTVESMEAER
jgi:hypothetical protein